MNSICLFCIFNDNNDKWFSWLLVKIYSSIFEKRKPSEIFYQSLFNLRTYKCPKNSICMCLVFTTEMVIMIIYRSRFTAISKRRESSEIFFQCLLINMMKKLIKKVYFYAQIIRRNQFISCCNKKKINSSLLTLYISV